MAILDSIFLGNTVRAWLIALVVAALVTAGLRLIRTVLLHRLRAVAERTRTSLDDTVVGVIDNTKSWFLLFLGLWAGSRWLTLPQSLGFPLRVIGVAAFVFQIATWANVAITAVIRQRVRDTVAEDPAEATTMAALGFLIRLAVWSVLLLAALANLGIEIGPLLAGLGVGGVAVALAVQNVLGDLFASLSIVLDKPFVIGDFIVVGDTAGTIENVGLKSTRVRSLTGEQLIYSNSDLLSARIRNYKRMYERRILFALGVTYQTPRDRLEKIPAIIRESIESQEHARFDRSHFKSYGAFSLDFETVFWVTTPDYGVYMDTQQAINLAIHERFEEEGIEFAYPTQTLFLERADA